MRGLRGQMTTPWPAHDLSNDGTTDPCPVSARPFVQVSGRSQAPARHRAEERHGHGAARDMLHMTPKSSDLSCSPIGESQTTARTRWMRVAAHDR